MSTDRPVQAPPKTCPTCGRVNPPLAPSCKACGHVFWVKRSDIVRRAPGRAVLPKVVTLVALLVLAFGAWMLMQPGDARHDPEPGVPTAASATASAASLP